MSKTLVINNMKREREGISSYSIYDISEIEDLFQLQQDMIDTGYVCDIFTVDEFWSYYSDSYCAVFLGYAKGQFNEDSAMRIIEQAKYPVYDECSGIEIIELNEKDEKKIKEQSKELFDYFNNFVRKNGILNLDYIDGYERILQEIFDYTDYIKTK